MVIDGLLLKLNAMGYTAQAYVDDLARVIQSKYLATVADLMQGSLRVVDGWCETKGLSINPVKTEMLLYTRKTKLRLQETGISSVKLNPSKEGKHLSAVLDDKLMEKAQVNAKAKKRLRALRLCKAFIARVWGLSPMMALWLYKRVIIPKITYATAAWWNRMGIALARSKLEHLQRAACIMITATLRTTSTRVLEMFLDLPTLETAVASVILMAAYRLPKPDPRNLGIGHNWTISSA